MSKTKIEVKNLKISFWTNNGSVRAVRDVSFNVEEGRTLAIVGESGSGKSVTAKAMLGILAGNALVEGGEIFYNGQDLMKVPEEVFHMIRGNNIAMIFQDPLSSLNPIMRVGKQLSEAMIANNIASRKQSKLLYTNMIKALKTNMVASGVSNKETEEIVGNFTKFINNGNALESKYNNARDSIETTVTNIDVATIELIGGEKKEVCQYLKRILKSVSHGTNPFLVREDDGEFKSALEKANSQLEEFSKSSAEKADREKMTNSLETLKSVLEKALNRPTPEFLALGFYAQNKNIDEIYSTEINKLNKDATKSFEDDFIKVTSPYFIKAMVHSYEKSSEHKKYAISEINKALDEFGEHTNIDVKKMHDIAKKLKETVHSAIDPMNTSKDSYAHTFYNAMEGAVKIYEVALNSEDKKPKKKAKMRKKFRLPQELDIKGLQDNIRLILERTKDSFEQQISDNRLKNKEEEVLKLIHYLDEQSSKMNYKMGKNLAKARSINLMREVGIPKPFQRYYQYPFEFSGGMRQRMVIAIALASNPDVLICDEPTTALDVTIQAQILELINDLKKERNLSVIFITHDLGVVANMADDIAVMYAGKIVEQGTADEVFYEAAHPYTWALLASMPDLETKDKLESIPGVPPNMIFPPKGDAFAQRNKYAMQIDFEEQPPLFEITPTHRAATWLLHPDAPKVEPPAIVSERIKRMTARREEELNAKKS